MLCLSVHVFLSTCLSFSLNWRQTIWKEWMPSWHISVILKPVLYCIKLWTECFFFKKYQVDSRKGFRNLSSFLYVMLYICCPYLRLGFKVKCQYFIWISSKLEMAAYSAAHGMELDIFGKENCTINSRFRMKCSFVLFCFVYKQSGLFILWWIIILTGEIWVLKSSVIICL